MKIQHTTFANGPAGEFNITMSQANLEQHFGDFFCGCWKKIFVVDVGKFSVFSKH
jgi:hypothetical protein